MALGLHGYGRYDDDPKHIGCPRAKSDMTPCIARDGHICLAEGDVCVGCGANPVPLLRQIDMDAFADMERTYPSNLPAACADRLAERVREITEDLA